ncbi:MAG TPA: mitochondrial fission ELM1 family protein [Vicinamibacterales bacterium]|nr:mitochondrial fission ELM1 family protein [Vicinamibacterales bacterium]
MESKVVWVLEGRHAGDNAQARAVATLSGGMVANKKLVFNALYHMPNILLGARQVSLDLQRSDPLAPPWPDLVVATGRRSVPVARWIRAQSGGGTKLVQIGRPRAPLDWFDLVITTAQYGLPHAPNVLQLRSPIVTADTAPAVQAEEWHDTFGTLPRPWIGVLVGGSRKPFRFDAPAARSLAVDASAMARELGGSLLISTSPRTPADTLDILAGALTVPHYLYRYGNRGPNPHQAILGLADRFIVTADSVSMIAEACLTGRLVFLADVPRKDWRPSFDAGPLLARRGIKTPPRDITRQTSDLVKSGHAVWLGSEPSNFVPLPDERPLVAERLRTLLA